MAYFNNSTFYAEISPSVVAHEAIHPLHSKNSKVFYSDVYLNDQNFIPAECWNMLTKLEDYNHALQQKRGVLYRLLKMLLGYKIKRPILPLPIYYHYFAYTAAALIAGNRRKLTWMTNPEGEFLNADDVIDCIRKHGIYGVYDATELGVSTHKFKEYKALFARMFNIDHRFGRNRPDGVRIENFVLAVSDDSRFPAPGYCPHCHTIDMWWENKTYKKTAVGEDYIKWEELMNTYDFLNKVKTPFTGAPDNSEFLFTMLDVLTGSKKYKNHYALTLQDLGDYAG